MAPLPLEVGAIEEEDVAVATPMPSSPRRPPGRRAAAERSGPRVDRSLRGVPDLPPWKNPTLWLFVIAAVLITWASAGYLNGSMPAVTTVFINAVGIYLGFTVLHESVHRLVHKNRFLNDILGWPTGLALTLPQTTFRAVHLMHHSQTNDPEVDPDFFVGQGPWWQFPIRMLSPLWEYRIKYYKGRWWRNGWELGAELATEALIVALIVGSVVTGAVAGPGDAGPRLPGLRLRQGPPPALRQPGALPRHPGLPQPGAQPPAPGPELPPRPPRLGHHRLVPLPAGVRRCPPGTGDHGRPHQLGRPPPPAHRIASGGDDRAVDRAVSPGRQGRWAWLTAAMARTERAVLLRRGLAFEYVTLAWNVVGVFVVGAAAIVARSVALAGFGLDSAIEISPRWSWSCARPHLAWC